MTSTIEMPMPTSSSRAERPSWFRQVGRDTAYTLTALVFAIPAFVVTVAGTALGLALLVLLFGIPVLAATTYAARGFAQVERARIRRLNPTEEVPAPTYRVPDPDASWLSRAATLLRDPQAWFDLGWTLMSFVSSIVAFVVTTVWWAVALGGLSYWFWEQFVPFDGDDELLVEILNLGEGRGAESVLMLVFGLLALVTLPLVVRATAAGQAGLGRVLLCARAEEEALYQR